MTRYTRRRLLGSSALAALGAFAGCTAEQPDDPEEDSPEEPDDGEPEDQPDAVPNIPQVDDPPNAVYKPTHREAMRHLPAVEAGDYRLSPMVTYPHSFWLITGEESEEVIPEQARGVHLMVTLWDAETGRVLPTDAGAEMRVLRDGNIVDQRAPWPMISQTMGFHFGDNVPLPADDTYTVEVDINPIQARRTGDFDGRFEEPATMSFEFEYDDDFREQVIGGVEYLDQDEWGQRGALAPPMEHGHDDHSDHDSHNDHNDHGSHNGHSDHNDHNGHNSHDGHQMPFSALPEADEYPGVDLGVHESGDARFVVRHLEASRFADDGYLLVSPRTPYNRVPLADMALSTEGPVETTLEQTLDSELGLHYGAAIDRPDSPFELVVESPPQVSRHAGYETAFLDMPSMTVGED
ncbi:uncharacterized protein NP_3028A [Natronomonas pharaonis DSM 2160]|uniref:DUF7350 domain-containing protein n=1 Tax=Natronomonas pharaonis (strain ATCC 35678 / DSM 2160 / CIP 103997 / JCM 8858 / NBRC 14720 / NCIMB 2260 / Gabara) TaxID=348780 RepID=A0A1U7EWX7_NATPD|nr:hypothetical protein [Natronomonas pharaonis]CAI49605.1 uncharacterized protein NP_3028A [Natronomonas pharaonis DSM 2160]